MRSDKYLPNVPALVFLPALFRLCSPRYGDHAVIPWDDFYPYSANAIFFISLGRFIGRTTRSHETGHLVTAASLVPDRHRHCTSLGGYDDASTMFLFESISLFSSLCSPLSLVHWLSSSCRKHLSPFSPTIEDGNQWSCW